MPELPEVETMVRGIRPHVEGRRIAALRRCRCRCKPISMRPSATQIQRRVKGTRIRAVRRLGKRIVLDLSSGESCVVEPRMTGLILLSDPPDRTHLRLQWSFADAGQYESLWFWDRRGLGTVRLYTPGELNEAFGPRNLGPDALEITEQEWRRRLSRTKRSVKVSLLDQKLVSGIGNLYASEILHRAGIHPARPADRIGHRQLRRLHTAARTVLQEAIRYEGSTLGDGTYRNALNRAGRYQNMHRVYNRRDESCLSCGKTRIVRIVQAQRSTYFCPGCQR